jgi:hypothetical protein
VGENGEFLFRGGMDDSRSAERVSRTYLADALQALADGKPIAVREARPLGCAIRR